MVDTSTGTIEEKRPIDIKFTNTLSYAERLMLKRHRRTELAEIQTPRLDESRTSMAGQSSSSSSFTSDRLGQTQDDVTASFSNAHLHNTRQGSDLGNGFVV